MTKEITREEHTYKYLNSFGKNFTVLFVEDDEVTLCIAEKILGHYFKEVLLARNGQEAYDIYLHKKLDMLITDNIMPKFNGIDLIKQIRETDDSLPIILITAHIDIEEMIECINLRVTQFLTKPFQKAMLLNVVENAIKKVSVKELSRKSNELMLENLKRKEQKYFDENERAFKKEINIIKNDLYYKFLPIKNQKWFFDIFYKPVEVLSGDSYTIRQINENCIFLCTIDAMGKGLSASITSMSSASFLNYMVDTQKEEGFDLTLTIKKYFQYMKSLLLEEEIICVSFGFFNFQTKTLTYALFGTPPILLHHTNGTLTKLKANNLPISKFSKACNIDEYTLKNLTKILIYSDGLNESTIQNKQLYGKKLNDDFLQSTNYKDFIEIIKARIETFDDDTTFLYISFCEYTASSENHTLTLTSEQKNIDSTIFEVESLLDIKGFNPDTKQNFMFAFQELLINAYEHGNLTIKNLEKQNALQNNVYEALIKEKEEKYKNRKITIQLSFEDDDMEKSVMAIIEDEGDGFDTEILKQRILNKKAFNGRGLLIAKKMLDGFYYNAKGNSVIIKKNQRKESNAY